MKPGSPRVGSTSPSQREVRKRPARLVCAVATTKSQPYSVRTSAVHFVRRRSPSATGLYPSCATSGFVNATTGYLPGGPGPRLRSPRRVHHHSIPGRRKLPASRAAGRRVARRSRRGLCRSNRACHRPSCDFLRARASSQGCSFARRCCLGVAVATRVDVPRDVGLQPSPFRSRYRRAGSTRRLASLIRSTTPRGAHSRRRVRYASRRT